jgi:predicted ArsR family transcriptional regulator
LKEIHDALGRHYTAEEIGRALQILATRGLARSKKESTGGRPATRWSAVEPDRKTTEERTKRKKRIKRKPNS